MKKKDIVDLIRYHVEGNDTGFRDLAYNIAVEFHHSGDATLGRYILNVLASKDSFYTPQAISFSSEFFKKIDPSNEKLLIPDGLINDVKGIINAIGYKAGVNKFLFAGPPGTGKSEMARHLARILNRQLYSVNLEYLIDSKLGQTGKNISDVFDEINRQSFPESLIILFDEIDGLAMDRVNSQDLREMGRATSAFMKGLDELKSDVILLATTNMLDFFDKALLRRFDKIVDFSKYTNDDLIDIAMSLLDEDLKKFRIAGRNSRICRRIFSSVSKLPYPGDLKNIIRTSIAFSDLDDPDGYIRNLMSSFHPDVAKDINAMQKMGFSLREMNILTGVSKSTLSRQLKEGNEDE